jgi:DNA-binding winged helix-turn-helix (wHTH) protein/Tol biopolymer transport system component
VALSPTKEMVRFGVFELDLGAAQLTRNGTNIRLPQQPLRLLSLLLESPGEIVTREQLRRRLWPSDVFIDFDHGLNKSIQKLRDALGDSADSPRYIETIPRVGYRFIAPVRSGVLPEPEVDTETPGIPPPSSPAAPSAATAGTPSQRWLWLGVGALAIAAAAAIALDLASRSRPYVAKYTQLTDFMDSATTPALSPDGHMLAFVRGGSTFTSAGQIYVKILPDGEARLLTEDSRLKYGLAFSPDGSEIAYTVIEQPFFSTYSISVLGGDSHLLLRNAAGLTWLDSQHLLFSRIRSGLHMGVVTSTITGDNPRELYFPPHERAMAHYSYASPDRKSALVVEMDGKGEWDQCRLISLDGSSPLTPVGPHGGCTSAAWSPDGSWMYFVATVDGQSHIWRQQSPNSPPEQITVGPSEDAGLAVEQDGRSILTSIGTAQSSIWIHDAAGARSLSSEGDVVEEPSPPSFRSDDKTLYYLLRHAADLYPELWRLTLDTGKAEAVFPGTSMVAYDVSPDGKQVVYTDLGRDGISQVWLAPMDRSSPARLIGHSGEATPYFGPQGQIMFQLAEGNVNYLEQMNQDGSGRSKVVPYPIIEIQGVSPERRWLTAIVPYPEGNRVVPMVMAIPLGGGPPRRICETYCNPTWSSSGRFLLVPVEAPSREGPGRSLVIPVGPGESLPPLPAGGISPGAEPDVLPGAQSLSRTGVVPGNDLSHYAYVKTTAHRNIYRISLP